MRTLSAYTRLVFVCLCVLRVFVVPQHARAQAGADPRGPISVRNGRPYNLLFLQFLPEAPDTLPKGASRFTLQYDDFNNLLAPTPANGVTVVEDNEEQRLLLAWRRGVGRGELALFVPILYRDGGYMDEVINGWHRLWGIDSHDLDNPAGRDAFGDYHSVLGFADRSGIRVNVGNAFGPGDVSATYKRALLPATPRSALALRAGLKLPTGNPGLLLGSGGLDAGLMLDARYNVGRSLVLYGGVGGILMGRATRVPNARSAMIQYQLAAEWRANSRDSYIIQSDVNGLAVRTGNPRADSAQSTITLGYERRLDRRLLMALSFSENGDWFDYASPLLGNVGPDFTTTLGFTWSR